jgi:hypothetical protein
MKKIKQEAPEPPNGEEGSNEEDKVMQSPASSASTSPAPSAPSKGKAAAAASSSSASSKPGLRFPWKLHQLLTTANETGTASTISWLPNGKSFKVHNKLKFAQEVMPAYFNSTKYKSFQRSLNVWVSYAMKCCRSPSVLRAPVD